jgi:hypothetical protein
MVSWVVYRIKTPKGDYVGVTGRKPSTRLSELRCHRGIDGVIEIVDSFDKREDALARERELVPSLAVGLNRSKGGFRAGGTVPKYGSANGSSLRVQIEGQSYDTLTAAAKAFGIGKTAVQYRLASPHFIDWTYLDPPRSAYWQKRIGQTQHGRKQW